MTSKRGACLLLLILMLSLIHGGLYASYMPAWGLHDEEQHVHYIQSLAEQGSIPVTGKTMLSPEIVDSVFETRRWERFMWPAPPARDPAAMGLEGQSYEGYQPPLYYLVLAPLYAVWPGSILSKLFALRWASVALSLVSVLLVFLTARWLFGDRSPLPYLTALVMAVIPERAAAVARVNNDVGVEVTAAAVICLCTAVCLRGLSRRSSLLLGAALGLTVLSKVSGALLVVPVVMTFWFRRREKAVILHSVVVAGTAVLLVAPWVVRNLRVYGDLTGSRGFDALANFSSPIFSGINLAAALWDMVRHFWFLWWKGAAASGNWLTTSADILLAVLLLSSTAGLVCYIRRARTLNRHSPQLSVLFVYIAAVASYAVLVLLGYFGHNLPVLGGRLPIPLVPPVMQGRYLLPVMSPIVILFALGLWQLPARNALFAATVGGLGTLSLAALFGNLVLYHYLWSPLGEQGIAAGSLAYPDRWRFLVSELLSDKPGLVRSMLSPLLILFAVLCGVVAVAVRRAEQALES